MGEGFFICNFWGEVYTSMYHPTLEEVKKLEKDGNLVEGRFTPGLRSTQTD